MLLPVPLLVMHPVLNTGSAFHMKWLFGNGINYILTGGACLVPALHCRYVSVSQMGGGVCAACVCVYVFLGGGVSRGVVNN